jgi:dipeptidyl aminopeptidase/acylaminoacyl peptidase
MYRRDLRDTDEDSLLATMAVVDSVVAAAPSPTDERVALAITREGQTDVWVADPDGAGATRLTSDGAVAMLYGRGEPKWLDWSPDGSEIAYVSAGGDLSVVDVETGETRALTEWDAPDSGLSWSPDGDRIAVVTDYWSRSSLGVVDPDGGSLTAWADDDYLYADPRWHGDALYAVRAHHRNLFDDEAELVRVTEDGPEAVFAESDVRVQCPRPRPGSAEVAFTHDGAGFDGVYVVEDDDSVEELYAVEGAEVAAAAWDDDGERLAVTVTDEGTRNVHVVDRDGESTRVTDEDVLHASPFFQGDDVRTIRESPYSPPALWDAGDERRLSPTAVAGLEERVPDPESFTYTSAGRDIHAVVFPPAADAEADSVPLVVNPHGGPTTFDGFGFQYRAAYFAALGYAVVLPNYRGSDGFGREFRNANDYDWGGGDLDDVINAADAVADAYDAVDGDRVGIFGGSGGGLMTVNALGNSDRFRAGAAFYGVYDYESFIDDTDDIGWQLMKRELGDLSTDLENYRDASPIRHVEEIDDPLLVLHGEEDARVPISQSEQLVEELEKHGKRHEFERYDGEPHGFTQRENVVDAYTRVADLFAKYLEVDPDDGSSRPHTGDEA